MADDADRADRLIENHLRLALSQRSKDTLPRTGFCHSHGEFLPGYFSVGVPLQLPSTRETYLFNCVMPAAAVPGSKLEADVGPRLAAMVRQLIGI